jgi:hypothetical protein
MVTETLPLTSLPPRRALREATPPARRSRAERLMESAVLLVAFAGGLALQIALLLAASAIIE